MQRRLSTLILLLPILLVPLFQTGTALADKERYPWMHFLRGNRIIVAPIYDGQTVPADEPSYVVHGFASDQAWKDSTPAYRRAFLKDDLWFYRLYVDEEEVALRSMTFSSTVEGSRLMFKFFYIQFDAGKFHGTHWFAGEYWADSDLNGVPELVFSCSITVNFT